MATTEKDKLIERISKASDRYGNRLIEFLERYKLSELLQATVEQLREYIADEAIQEVTHDRQRKSPHTLH